MVGDSAITRRGEGPVRISDDGIKVQYSARANIGFAIWGRCNLPDQRLDYWLRDFIEASVREGNSVEDVGVRLADGLNEQIARMAEPRRLGIHIAGFRDGIPVLFHVHSGHLEEQPHELRLYRDYPDDKQIPPDEFEKLLARGVVFHLRNGYYVTFSALFDSMLHYIEGLRELLGVELPQPSIRGRLDFYKLLVRFVADTLKITARTQSVNDRLCCVAFDGGGLRIDERLPSGEQEGEDGGNFDVEF